ncbi:hypothetical protein TNCV_2769511 [Trichonephila clavipes]|nr:hypothetical protein TNCV_2769511 [Trichonephila clavipes]
MLYNKCIGGHGRRQRLGKCVTPASIPKSAVTMGVTNHFRNMILTVRDILYCRHRLKHLASLEKTIVLQWVPAHCRVPGNEKGDFLADNGALTMQKIYRPVSFYSCKNLIKKSIKAHSQEDLYNRVSFQSWKNSILNLRNVSRHRVFAEFRLVTGQDYFSDQN